MTILKYASARHHVSGITLSRDFHAIQPHNGSWNLQIPSTAAEAAALRPVLSLPKERTDTHPMGEQSNTPFVLSPELAKGSKPVLRIVERHERGIGHSLPFLGSTILWLRSQKGQDALGRCSRSSRTREPSYD